MSDHDSNVSDHDSNHLPSGGNLGWGHNSIIHFLGAGAVWWGVPGQVNNRREPRFDLVTSRHGKKYFAKPVKVDKDYSWMEVHN